MNTKLTQVAIAAVALIAIATGSNAHAQATIDQTKALAGSVTPGDTAGFPVTLSVPGAYKLTGNLVVPVGASGIHINATGVTLDLNGFNISGPGTCTRNSATYDVVCPVMSVVTHGVYFKVGGNTVRNGQVRGFYTGVFYFGADRLEDLLVEQNYGYGVVAANTDGARTTIRGVRSQLNGASGFNLGDAMVQASSAGSNGVDGFSGSRAVVIDSTAYGNKGTGFKGVAVGRSVAQSNKTANIAASTSLGNNLNGNVPF